MLLAQGEKLFRISDKSTSYQINPLTLLNSELHKFTPQMS